MALQKQTVAVPFGQGIETKTDVKQVPEGKLTEIENGYFQTLNMVRKRPGYEQLGSSIPSGMGISSYKDELVSLDGSSVYSYSTTTDSNYSKGTKIVNDLDVFSVVSNTSEQTVQDSAYLNGLYVFVYQDSLGGIRYTVIDSDTGQAIVKDVQITSTGFKPKVKVIGTFFVIVFGDTSNNALRYCSIDESSPTALSSISNLATNFATSGSNFDLCESSNRLYVVYNTTTSNTIGMRYFDTSLVLSAETAANFFAANDSITCFYSSSSNQLWVVYGYNSNALYYFVRDANLGSVLSNTLVENVPSSTNPLGPYPTSFTNVTGLATGSSASIWYEVEVTLNGVTKDPSNFYTRTANLTNGGVVSGISDFVRSVGLASKAFTYNSNNYLVLTHQSTLQPMYFLVNGSGVVGTKIAPFIGGGLSEESHLAEVNFISTHVYQFAYLVKSSVTNSADDTLYALLGVNSAQITFDAVPDMLEMANNLHIGGGILSMYDGASVVEHGFHLYPEDVAATTQMVNGGVGAGTYSYTAIYQWIDNQGQVHRSAPSVPLSVPVGTGDNLFNLPCSTTNGSATVTVENGLTTRALVKGMAVSGTGIPANAYITGIPTSTTFTISPFATATSTSPVILTITPYINYDTNGALVADFQINALGRNATLGQIQGVFVYGYCDSGTPEFYAFDTSSLKVGMGYTIANSAPISTSISPPSYLGEIIAIDGNKVTMSSNFSFSSSNVALYFYTRFTGNFTLGSATITNVPSSVFTNNLVYVGQRLEANDSFISDTDVIITGLSPSTNQILMNKTAVGTNTSVPILAYYPGSILVKRGQSVVGTSLFPAGTYVEEVDESIESFAFQATGRQSVIFSEDTKVTSASSPFSISPVLEETYQVKVRVPTLRVTQKQGTVSDPQIIVYRTELNGTIFYQVSSFTDPVLNDPTVDYVDIIDILNDDAIISRNQLYTTGGEVENLAAPAVKAMTTYRNRIIAIPSEKPLTYIYTKQVIPTSPAEFSSLLFTENIDQRIGQATACQPMDDKLILFGPRNIFYVVGDGPTPAGTNNDFIQAQLIASDTGTTNKNSTLLTPMGVTYQSANGIYLLQRDLSVNYIGADVEAYNSSTITSANLVPGYTHFRMSLNTDKCLVYDYYARQWSVFYNISANDATIFNGKYTLIRSNGLIGQETPNAYTDYGDFIKLKVTTAWMKFAKILGFQRIWKMLLLGEYYSAHDLTVNFFYDFSTTSGQTVTFTPSALIPYEYRLFNSQQRCEALKISIEDVQVSNFGQGYGLSALAFEVGVKTGLDKLPAAQSYG